MHAISLLRGGVFPTRFGKEGKNFAQTFGQWRKGTTKSQNSFEYYLDGLSILSPLDIIFLQDEIDQTNWVPHFCQFVRMRLTNECHATPERNTSCTEFPWLFCLTHMLHERLIVQTDRGVLPRMFKIIGAMRGYIHSRTMEGIYSVATFKDWVSQVSAEQFAAMTDRRAQFCWFLASTIGNTDLNCAGAWFPFCAKSRDDTSEIFGVLMTGAEVRKLDEFLMGETIQSVRGVVAVETGWVKAPLAQLKMSDEQDIMTVGFETPSSVSGSMSSRDPFTDLGIPPPLPVQSRAPTPEPPTPPPRKKRSPSPRTKAQEVLGIIAEGEEFSEVSLVDIPPMLRPSPSPERLPERLPTISEFQADSLFIMPPPDPYTSPGGVLPERGYPTGDDFVSYSSQPVERRVVVRKRPREETRAADRPLARAKRTRVDPDPIYIVPEDDFTYWPYLAFGTVLILLAYITEDPRAPSQ